jgi:hypothetical protein
MGSTILLNPKLIVERLEKAMNDHDIDAFVDCFDPFYFGEEPAHPNRAIRGREFVRKEWANVFSRIRDFHAKVISIAVEKDTVCVEWHWTGTQLDKSKLDVRGVTILGVKEGRFVWARLFMEPVDEAGTGMKIVTG